MAVKRTTQITIETEQLLVMGRKNPKRVWCQQCAAEVDMVAIEGAAKVARMDAGAIQRLLKGEQIHLVAPGGSVGICLNSLLRFMNQPF